MSKQRKKAPRARRPGKGEAERLTISVSAETAAWLRAEASALGGCSLGDVIEGARLAVQAADAHALAAARRGLRSAGELPSSMLVLDAEAAEALERLGLIERDPQS